MSKTRKSQSKKEKEVEKDVYSFDVEDNIVEGDDIYEVEELVKKRQLKGAAEPEYFIKWKGYDR
jgi:hypothetical protein